MRDLLLSAVITALLLLMLKRPEVGAYVWAWLSIMNPHTLTYGFARSVPWAQLTAVLFLLTFMFSKARRPFPWSSITAVYLALLVWMGITSISSINPPDLVLDRWIFVMKIHFMMLITFMSLRGRQQIQILMGVVVGSIAFYGVKGGLWTLATGGGGRVWGPPGGMIAGNNEIAVAMVMMMPLMYYFHATARSRAIRLGLAVSMAAMAFGILGTQSRGALLSMLAMALMLGLKGKRPIRTSLIILGLCGLVVAFMPDSWTQRMDTIQGYKDDTSAMSRIYTWYTLWNVALDRPLLGAGFVIDNIELFHRYAPNTAEFAAFRGDVWVAHSIYFQALGEHGFVGLGLYLAMGLLTYLQAGKLARAAKQDAEFASWVPLLMRMVQASLIGFAVGGAFLTLMHLDVTYYLVAVVVLTKATVADALKHRSVAPAVPAQVQTGMNPATSRP